MTCTIDGCERSDIRARGLCRMHYRRWDRHGDPHVVGGAHRQPGHCRVRRCLEDAIDGELCFEHYWLARWPLPLPDLLDEPEPGWHHEAACLDDDQPDDWFPTGAGAMPTARAIALCAVCPVRASCLADALDTPPASDLGVWGGIGQIRRAQLRHQRQVEPERRSA